MRALATFNRTLKSAGSSFALAMVLLVGWANPAPAHAAPGTFSAALPPVVSKVFVRFPKKVVAGQTLRVLVALNGIEGDGESLAGDLTAAADQYGWVLVAPTIAYGDWMDPMQLAREDAVLINWLSAYLSQLTTQKGRHIHPGVLLLGYSRGAQLAHRFAEAHPERVVAVAAVSAGSYTLPEATAADGTLLAFPYGVGDFPATVGQGFECSELRAVHFWVAVGDTDTNPEEVPREFDPYLGGDRVRRARTFVAALDKLDVSAELVLFADVAHALTPAMEGAAITFLADQSGPSA
jgi:pimeloyl-ACP methyl ester carboxylesterase